MPKSPSSHLTKLEKQLIISCINEYSLFGATDAEIVSLIASKTDRNLSKDTIRGLKKEAMTNQEKGIQWLDRFTRGAIIDHYIERIDEVKAAQRIVLKWLHIEDAKPPVADPNKKGQQKANVYLINQLAKTVGELSTKLAEAGMSPPVIAKLYSMIPKEILEGNDNAITLETYLKYLEKDKKDDRKAIFDKNNNSNVMLCRLTQTI